MERHGRLEERFPWLRVKELKADTQYLCLHSLSSRPLGSPLGSRAPHLNKLQICGQSVACMRVREQGTLKRGRRRI